MNILFANISKFHQLIGYILEVGSGAVLGGIDPLDHLGIAPAGYPRLHTRSVVGGPRDLVVVQLDIVYPTVDNGDDQLLQIQPQVVPIVGLLAN